MIDLSVTYIFSGSANFLINAIHSMVIHSQFSMYHVIIIATTSYAMITPRKNFYVLLQNVHISISPIARMSLKMGEHRAKTRSLLTKSGKFR